MEMPLVSILITSYNREWYIEEAINSVLAQTYKKFEIVIVDNCSTDGTKNIIERYKDNEKIRIYFNENNIGQFPNRNKAASLAKGELLLYVDSDDTIAPDAIEYVVKSFRRFPHADFATLYKDDDITEALMIDSQTIINKHLFEKSILYIGPGGTVISRELFEKNGGFPLIYGPACDMYYNIKMASNAKVLLLPYNYLNYRCHEGQEINNSFPYLYDGYRYFDDIMYLPELPLNQEERKYLVKKNKRRFIVNLSKFILKGGSLKNASKAISLAEFRLRDFFEGIFN
jgi:glycosyltransferase involved in cell wall biosynthesis